MVTPRRIFMLTALCAAALAGAAVHAAAPGELTIGFGVEVPEDPVARFRQAAAAGVARLDKQRQEQSMPAGSGHAEMAGGMAQGKPAMMIDGSWSWDHLRRAKIDFGVARIPVVGSKKAAAPASA